jgi:hypothetical protein
VFLLSFPSARHWLGRCLAAITANVNWAKYSPRRPILGMNPPHQRCTFYCIVGPTSKTKRLCPFRAWVFEHRPAAVCFHSSAAPPKQRGGDICLKTKNHSAEGEPSTLEELVWADQPGRTFNAGTRLGLFYSWPVAPQQSRLRFKRQT